MYVNTGGGNYIRSRNIIGIFDMDTATVCVATRNFLSGKEKAGKVYYADEDVPKSFFLLDESDGGDARRPVRQKAEETVVYLTKFSSGVLFSRTDGNITAE